MLDPIIYSLLLGQIVIIIKMYTQILAMYRTWADNELMYEIMVRQYQATMAHRHPLGRPWSLIRMRNWYEEIVPTFDDAIFKENFSVTRNVFNILCTDLSEHMIGQHSNFRSPISLEKRIAIGLFRLASTSELRVISHLFGVGISTVHKIQYLFTKAIVSKYRQQIKWPDTAEELNRIANEFETEWNYPLCIGGLDGCHVPCSPNAADAVDYHNYKGWYSVVLFAVCDTRYKFTYINVGTPGKVNDGFIFRYSDLYNKLKDKAQQLRELGRTVNGIRIPLHLIGDSAFPLLDELMKPFPYLPSLAREKKHFNYRLSRARRVIENAFGRLKARFRCLLKRIEMQIDNVQELIVACAILHNICESNNDRVPPNWITEIELVNDNTRPLVPPGMNRAALRSSVEIREALVDLFQDDFLLVEE